MNRFGDHEMINPQPSAHRAIGETRLRVHFDGQIFFRQSVGGISRYFVSLARELVNIGELDATITAPIHVNQYLRDESTLMGSGKYIKKPPHSARLVTIANIAWLMLNKRQKAPDLLHQTYYNKNDIFFPSCPTVTTVHDLINERNPRDFSRADNIRKHKKYAINRANHIICVSNSTRNDLIDIYGVRDSDVSVIHLASDLPVNDPITVENPIGIPYILYVGRRNGFKNWLSLLKAISGSQDVWKDFALVCFGGGPPTRSECRSVAELKIPRNRLIFTSGSDTLLADLYRFATALIFQVTAIT